jgi:hypothetical protein
MMGWLPSSSTSSPHCDRVNFAIHCEAEIELVWRNRWGLQSTEVGETLRGRDRVSLELHLEAVI